MLLAFVTSAAFAVDITSPTPQQWATYVQVVSDFTIGPPPTSLRLWEGLSIVGRSDSRLDLDIGRLYFVPETLNTAKMHWVTWDATVDEMTTTETLTSTWGFESEAPYAGGWNAYHDEVLVADECAADPFCHYATSDVTYVNVPSALLVGAVPPVAGCVQTWEFTVSQYMDGSPKGGVDGWLLREHRTCLGTDEWFEHWAFKPSYNLLAEAAPGYNLELDPVELATTVKGFLITVKAQGATKYAQHERVSEGSIP